MFQEIKQELEKNGYKLYSDETEVNYTLENSYGVVVEFLCDEGDSIKECLQKELNYHINMVDIEDEDYCDGCDIEYLKSDWKKELENILNIISHF